MMSKLYTELTAKRSLLAAKSDKGFTLIELLVVVIIIGILAAIAIPIYVGVQNNAKDSSTKSDLTNAKTAVVAYYTEKGSSATAPTDWAVALPDYGYSKSADTKTIKFTVTSSSAFTICGTSSADHSFQVSATGGVTTVTSC
jgi:type IV pilus assembly protein PilA